MEETLLAKTVHLLVFLALCAAIIVIGWHEPLHYRFMSPEQIAEIEVSKEPPPKPWQSVARPGGTALDRAPYEVQKGKLKYSESYDPRKLGAPTETDRRGNTVGKP